MTEALPFTLIIPAHNEEAVIARCLATAMNGAPAADSFEIIVAANGCEDRTTEIARKVAPHAVVLDLPTGSKTGAINAANRIASHYPRIVLDADVECDYNSLAAVACVLRQPGVMTAAPAIRLNKEHCNFFVKSYYSAWIRQPYAKAGKGGAGCYGFSQGALESIGEFPPIIGDDIWIHTRFPDDSKRLVENDARGRHVYSIVRPPRTLRQQVKVEARRMEGNGEVRRDYPSPYLQVAKQRGGLIGSLQSGTAPIDLAIFLTAKMLVRIETRRRRIFGGVSDWTRDLSSREL